MVERFIAREDTLYAVLDDGRLLETVLPTDGQDLTGLSWRQILSDVPGVNDVAGIFVA